MLPKDYIAYKLSGVHCTDVSDASGMLTFERTGRIPVPVRICYPTDLNHEIDPRIPEILHPFEHFQSVPRA